MRLTQLATMAPLKRAPYSLFVFLAAKEDILSHSLSFVSFTQSYIHTYARAQITYTHFFMFVNILFSPPLIQLSNLGDISLHKLFKNNILHYNVCIIYQRSPNSNKICQTASKICANGSRKHDNSDPIPREHNI